MISQAPAWFGPELSVEEASQYADAVAQSLRDTQIVFELPVSGADEFRQAASVRLEAALSSDTSDEEILNAMQKDFEAIVERRGQDTVRDSQRRGLGMFPVPKKRTGTD